MLSNSILRMINQDCFPWRERSGSVFAIQIVCGVKSAKCWKDKFSARINSSRSHWDLAIVCWPSLCELESWLVSGGLLRETNKYLHFSWSHIGASCLLRTTPRIEPVHFVQRSEPSELARMATVGGQQVHYLMRLTLCVEGVLCYGFVSVICRNYG